MGSSSVLVSIAIGAVAVVLVLGLANMLRGGSPDRSQNLMRLRVVLQAVAILLIVLVLWWRGH
jgi:hypoxia induced protein